MGELEGAWRVEETWEANFEDYTCFLFSFLIFRFLIFYLFPSFHEC